MANAEQTHELLAKIAAVTYEPITYGHLQALTGVPSHFQGSMLKAVQKRCKDAQEPDLTSLVVTSESREVADGHAGADPASERRRCYDFHSARVKAIKATS